MVTRDYVVFDFQGISLYYAFFSGMFRTFMCMKNGITKNDGMVLKSRLLLKGTGRRTEYVVLEELWQMFSQFSPHSCIESKLNHIVTFYVSENWSFSVFTVQNIALYATNGRHHALCPIPFPIRIRFSWVLLSLFPSLLSLSPLF